MPRSQRIKATVVACVSLSAVALSAAPAGAAETAPGQARAWECQPGFSCYYDSHYGENWLFNAGRCGEHNLLGGIYQNRISSIYNRGNGTVRVYRLRTTGWEQMASIAVGRSQSFLGEQENEIDRIVIGC